MKMAKSCFFCVAMQVLIGQPIFAAGLAVVEPDVFPSGTNISNAFPGVTLVALGQTNPSVISLGTPPTSTGTRVFGNSQNGNEWGDGFNGGMRVNFASPTNYVQIDIIGNDDFDIGRLLAYNSSDTLLSTFTTPTLVFGTISTASVTRPGSDIAYVIATGSADSLESVSLDNLQFGSVPEPSAVMLLGLGSLAILLGFRRTTAT